MADEHTNPDLSVTTPDTQPEPEDRITVTTSDFPQVAAPEPEPEPEPKRERGEDGKFKAKDDDEEPDGRSLPTGIKKRIARSNRQRDEALAEAERLRAEVERLRAEKAAPDTSKPLNPDDFDTHEDYEAAVLARAEAKKAPKSEETAGQKLDAADEAFLAASGADFTKAQADVREAVDAYDPDLWERVAKADVRISASLVVSLSETEKAAELLEAITADPDLGEKLSKMTPFQQARELAKMEAGLGKPPEKRTTNAPDPVEPVRTGGRPGPRELADLSQREYEERRNKEETASPASGWL